MPPTPSQTVGPFFGYALPFQGDATAVDPRGPALRVEGQLLDGAGAPVGDGLLEVWSKGQFARCRTDPEGVFHFVVEKPAAGAGDGAPHLEVTVFARGLLRHLATRMYFPGEPSNASDPALELAGPRRQTLVARDQDGVLRFDIRLQGDDETVFFEL